MMRPRVSFRYHRFFFFFLILFSFQFSLHILPLSLLFYYFTKKYPGLVLNFSLRSHAWNWRRLGVLDELQKPDEFSTQSPWLVVHFVGTICSLACLFLSLLKILQGIGWCPTCHRLQPPSLCNRSLMIWPEPLLLVSERRQRASTNFWRQTSHAHPSLWSCLQLYRQHKEIQGYVCYFVIMLILSVCVFFNALHMKMD